MKNQMVTSAQYRPVVYMAVQGRVCRSAIVDVHGPGRVRDRRNRAFPRHVVRWRGQARSKTGSG
jgi:hypothetical protein